MNLERTFFVTTVTWKRTPIFRQHASAQLMVDVLKHYAEQGKFVLHEFVIMTDHLHLLLSPAKDISLERVLQVIKVDSRIGTPNRRRRAGAVRSATMTDERGNVEVG